MFPSCRQVFDLGVGPDLMIGVLDVQDNKWAWKDVLPKEGEPTTKEFRGNQWCHGVKCQ
jgi:hypothetical protein